MKGLSFAARFPADRRSRHRHHVDSEPCERLYRRRDAREGRCGID